MPPSSQTDYGHLEELSKIDENSTSTRISAQKGAILCSKSGRPYSTLSGLILDRAAGFWLSWLEDTRENGRIAMRIEKIPIDKIKVTNRVRTDFGDMETLKNSIRKYGLLNPVLIDADYNLIAGARRLRAAKDLGFTVIDSSMVEEKSKLVRFDMEMQENLVRKDFTEEEINRSIEMKKRLLRKPWYMQIWLFFKRLFEAFLSLFRKK
jgi:ParB family chromosome partitioning protein